MNPLIYNLLSAEVGISDAKIAGLTGLPIATVQSELTASLASGEAYQAAGLWFLGIQEVDGPVAVAANSAGGGVIALNTSGRWYARNGRWYGPNNTLGPNYLYWNTNYGSSGQPDYRAQGFVMPRDVTLTRVAFWFRPNDSTYTYTARLIRQVKSDDSSSVTNTTIGSDLVFVDLATNRQHLGVFDLADNTDLDQGDVVVPILKGNANQTRYLYFSMSIEAVPR